jgi:hypothetical protein
MKQTTQRFILLALMALLALFAGCKGESPTAPPPITGTTGNGSGSTGGTQPPTGASIALAVSTAAPFTGSTSTITATVTQNNVSVPNGTAVEFATTATNANFTDTADNPTTLIRTTTNGVAKATVTSSTAGPVIVTVTVNNVTKSVTLNFQDVIINNPTPTSPTISSITPATGLPAGNQPVVITGTNFRVPVHVIFDPGNGLAPKEGFVSNVTPTQITVTTPAFDLSVAQQVVANVTVIVEAGTPTEQRVTKAAAFTITAPVLTPVIRALSPTSGPIDGGTRVTITGDAFEAPVQVFFGSAQAQIVGSVTFHSFDVFTPTARDTNPDGSGAKTGPVDVKVLNQNSGKSVVAPAAFRYVNKAQITAITPNQGPFIGGTRVLIDGTGFNDPVTVFLDGIAASVIKVTPTEITAISNGIAVTSCADATGPVIVTNVDNGDTATAPTAWIYRVFKPAIVGVTTSGVTLNGNAVIRVANAVGIPRILIGGSGASITSQVDNSDGTTSFTVQIPSTLTLSAQACPAGASAPQPTAFDVVYTSVTTGCTDTLTKGLTVGPPNTAAMTLSPISFTPFNATITPGSPGPPIVPPTVSNPPAQTVNIVSTGVMPLIITSVVAPGPGCGGGPGQFSVTLPPAQTLNACESAPITAKYNATTVASSANCTVTINTSNAGTKILQLSGSSQ